MAQYRFFQIDAFTNEPLKGNPAAIIPLDSFLPTEKMQAIAAENNVAETAFIVSKGNDVWDIRWFTPSVEVPLCGHATLASAYVLFETDQVHSQQITFQTTHSGNLFVSRLEDGRLEMDFPAYKSEKINLPNPKDIPEDGVWSGSFLLADFTSALRDTPSELWSGPFMLAIFSDAETVRNLKPDTKAISKLSLGHEGDTGNLICTAIDGATHDVVSRVFCPGSGIPEDPATGSAHCMIAPLFSKILDKQSLNCFQAFPGRGADIATRLEGDRVKLIGSAVLVIDGHFNL
ncbi:PhzF family phenazine biosynthesis protein [Hirschia baltica]|uniref:Phenazine biosynthesis protein PhzF family n=1 Tax=Hirschia baltica (strain ATCC 49814 / DSM 5838 / IFAM 1418) TaxID=582402 RepID=C6XNE3_HIRBI|nr:PhzF family phenazine biosynthesis protein [Hirschia baltica]ACT60087.1 phenazine biosynthesis protein PhzF family [Hirschia baltica ATCC 49814]